MIEENEYYDLPDDPDEAFAVFQMRRANILQEYWDNNNGGQGWGMERQYIDRLIAFDEVYGLGLFTGYPKPPTNGSEFSEYFEAFRRAAETASQKILMEAARRRKSVRSSVVLLDQNARAAIHQLISSIKEKLNELSLSEEKRESLFGKLNAFAAEVDRNRTHTEAFFSFAVELARTAKAVNDEIKPLQHTIDRLLDWLDKAKDWKDALPPWRDRKKIEGPQKKLPKPAVEDDDIPF
jgi:hypothetical protein